MQARTRGRGRRWILIGVGTLLVAALAAFVGRFLHSEWKVSKANSDLKNAIAETDASEPGGWHLSQLEQQRKAIPDEQNGAKIVIMASAELPKDGFDDFVIDEIQREPPCCRLTPELSAKLKEAFAILEPAAKVSRQLVNYNTGRFAPLQLDKERLGHVNPRIPEIHELDKALQCDVLYYIEQGKLPEAWQSALAEIHLGRTIGDEPAIVSQVARLSVRKSAARSLERILARGVVAPQELSRARDRLSEEAAANLLSIGIRGERADKHDFYTRIATEGGFDAVFRPAEGKDGAASQFQPNDAIRRGLIDTDPRTRRSVIAASHAYLLRAMNSGLACSTLPEAQLDRCFENWTGKLHAEIGREQIPLLAGIFTAGLGKVHTAERNNIASMRCAVVGLAAEEFRSNQNRWPKDMAELKSAGLIRDTPFDPISSEPLCYRVTTDGIVVYSVGQRRDYDGNAWDDLSKSPLDRALEFQNQIEFRLWNVDRRNLAPVPRPDETKP